MFPVGQSCDIGFNRLVRLSRLRHPCATFAQPSLKSFPLKGLRHCATCSTCYIGRWWWCGGVVLHFCFYSNMLPPWSECILVTPHLLWEQGIVGAFRIIRHRLNCCVEGFHHSGKANARKRALDQYAVSGGSTVADGSRMMVVMQPLDAKECLQTTGARLDAGESGLVMALPKLCYAPPQNLVFIRRHGF